MELKPKMNFQEARTFGHTIGLKNKKEWYRYSKSGDRPREITSNPTPSYRDKGWISWLDWLGTTTSSRKKEMIHCTFLSFLNHFKRFLFPLKMRKSV